MTKFGGHGIRNRMVGRALGGAMALAVLGSCTSDPSAPSSGPASQPSLAAPSGSSGTGNSCMPRIEVPGEQVVRYSADSPSGWTVAYGVLVSPCRQVIRISGVEFQAPTGPAATATGIAAVQTLTGTQPLDLLQAATAAGPGVTLPLDVPLEAGGRAAIYLHLDPVRTNDRYAAPEAVIRVTAGGTSITLESAPQVWLTTAPPPAPG